MESLMEPAIIFVPLLVGYIVLISRFPGLVGMG